MSELQISIPSGAVLFHVEQLMNRGDLIVELIHPTFQSTATGCSPLPRVKLVAPTAEQRRDRVLIVSRYEDETL